MAEFQKRSPYTVLAVFAFVVACASDNSTDGGDGTTGPQALNPMAPVFPSTAGSDAPSSSSSGVESPSVDSGPVVVGATNTPPPVPMTQNGGAGPNGSPSPGGAEGLGGTSSGGDSSSLGGLGGALVSMGGGGALGGSAGDGQSAQAGGSGEPLGGTGGSGGHFIAPDEPITVWIAGDSTVANGNTPCPAGWGKHFDPLVNDLVSVVNSAVGGRSVRTWMYNVQSQMDASGECVLERDIDGNPTLQARWQTMLDGMSTGDYLLIQFGINDGSATCDRHVGIEAFKETYGVLAAAAYDRGAQPIFITPVSAIGCNGSTARETRGGYVGATFDAGEQFDVPVIDLHQLSIDRYNELAFCPVPGGDVSAGTGGPVGDFFCDDHTHFSDMGAAEIAQLVAQALVAQGIGLSRYLQ